MSYSTGEALIVTKTATATGFTSSNVTRGKWGILNGGASDHYAIVKPGAFAINQESITNLARMYRTVVQVWQRYKDDGTSLTTLEGHVENVIAALQPWRKLGDTGGTIRDAYVSGGGEVTEEWRTNADGPSWLKQELFVDWIEENYVTYQE